ncbi:hypothetical protein EXIGLDRAFT_637291 [Exidia glandulosa HHB12029]|uniref:GDP-fucose protein O-fucosyltransferase 2 n=1 Tax=Exidia glandulosa HHB12029 TaxID=1314781 RepID=A0A165PUV5_EXIGL|nr:hypothetical protein EXIGLDRAFT_637291 [Exidia glandulosa HHB12029]
MAQHHWGAGYNNLWEEFILLHEISLRANRSYVFIPLVFADQTVWPMNTFMSGPTAGGPWPAGVDAPRAISSSWWETACPPSRRRSIDASQLWNQIGLDEDSDGETIVSKWAAYLKDLPDPCVQVDGRNFFSIDFWFGRPQRTIAVWPTLHKSPIMTHHAWSKAVYSAVSRNLPLLTAGKMSRENERFSHIVEGDVAPVPAPLHEYKEMSNVLALHIRRGDYEGHCWILAQSSVPYASWNVLLGLPDVYKPDPNDKMAMIPHCLPTPQQVASRVQEVTKTANLKTKLETIYLMTNANEVYLEELRVELKKVGHDKVIIQSDLELRDMEKAANMIVDMEIGTRAAVFIGNGFSTLTSTVVALRTMRGASLNTSRFW